jgi:FLYWCH zinc finger domain
MLSGNDKSVYNYSSPDLSQYILKDESLKKRVASDGRIKKDVPPLLTSYTVPFQFIDSGRRNQLMICEGRRYIQNNKYGDKIYWKCSSWHSGCKARAITLLSQPDCIIRRNDHNHPDCPDPLKDDEELKALVLE